MPSSSVYAGIARGASNVAQYERDRPERESKRAQARSSQQLAKLKLQDYKSAAPLRKSQQELELEQTRNELAKEQEVRLKSESFSAFDRYEANGDTKHLNNFLVSAKSNPADDMWSHWARFDPVVQNKQTEALLGQKGITDVDAYFSDPDLVKSKVMATAPDGSQTLIDLNMLYQFSGYTEHLGDEELEKQIRRAKLESLIAGPQTAETNIIAQIAKEEGLSTLEASNKYLDLKGGTRAGSTLERVAKDIQTNNPGMSRLDALAEAKLIIEPRTSTAKDVDLTSTAREELHTIAGGDFYEADMSDVKQRRKMQHAMSTLMQSLDYKPKSEDKRTIRQLKSAFTLAGKAGEKLTDAETGLFDSLFVKVKKYVSDNVSGTEGTATYETFRNSMRRALSGLTVSTQENANFNKAAGTLGQQLGPVLQQLQVQVEDIKNNLQSSYDMEDEMIAHWQYGKSLDEIDQVIEALDQRIALFKDFQGKKPEGEKRLVSPKPIVTRKGKAEGVSAADFYKDL